jgi:hypothetical protein
LSALPEEILEVAWEAHVNDGFEEVVDQELALASVHTRSFLDHTDNLLKLGVDRHLA